MKYNRESYSCIAFILRLFVGMALFLVHARFLTAVYSCLIQYRTRTYH
jgi:hypothetical protein